MLQMQRETVYVSLTKCSSFNTLIFLLLYHQTLNSHIQKESAYKFAAFYILAG